ncbi:MAG: hypothetical protein IPM48_03680 [Saprospiraceae bacterium]|nr:hypothetical protein [Saprospiraceae bacterium]
MNPVLSLHRKSECRCPIDYYFAFHDFIQSVDGLQDVVYSNRNGLSDREKRMVAKKCPSDIRYLKNSFQE